MPPRTNRGLGVTERQTKENALKIAMDQLKKVHWLILFEDNTCSVVRPLGDSVCLDLSERLHIKVSTCFLFFFIFFKKETNVLSSGKRFIMKFY